MKRKFFFLAAPMLALLLTGCGKNGGDSTSVGGGNEDDYDYQAPLESIDRDALENELVIHYGLENEGKDRAEYNKWRTWLWADGKDGSEYKPNGIDSFGSIFHYSLSEVTGMDAGYDKAKIGMIVKTKGNGSPWANAIKDGDADRFIDLSALEADAKGNYEIWLQSGISTIYDTMPTSRDSINNAYFFANANSDEIRLFVNTIGKFNKVELFENGVSKEAFTLTNPTSAQQLEPKTTVEITSNYTLKVTFASGVVLETPVSFYPLFETKAFTDAYDYDGFLGVEASDTETKFAVWSPMSTKIVLRVYESGTPKSVDSLKGNDTVYKEVELTKGEKGVFAASINEDLRGKYYTYLVTNGVYKNKEIVDPYARGAGVNGRRGMIVDFSKTNPEGWEETKVNAYDRKQLVVYETHVKDVTSSKTWTGKEANRGKYLGLVEKGTSYSKDGKTTPTGFDYLTSLGFNALQIMPMFDQDNDEINGDYNWGYNPLNYNVLEGAYSSDPHDGYARIKEFKEVVQAYTKAGINIVMDVVYNHVSSASGSNFDVLMPGYYFRYTAAGKALSNGSGCGNETASDHTMMRRFIVDSANFLAKEYKLGGFRFDLMALEDLDTMEEVASSLKEIDPSIAVYGEPWTGGTSPLGGSEAASQANGIKYKGYGQFNDGMRDALIKGGMKGANEIGFVTAKDDLVSSTGSADREAIVAGLAGHTLSTGRIYDADKTVNYVTCHDNYTLSDRFDAAAKANSIGGKTVSYTKEEKKAMNVLANSFVLTSLGTSFLNAGEEFLRTKGGSHNSYGGDPLTQEMVDNGFDSWTKVNELDYALAIENADMVEMYKKMIATKTKNKDFAQASTKETNPITVMNSAPGVIIVELKGEEKTYRIAYRNGLTEVGHVLDLSGFNLEWATNGEEPALSAATELKPYQTILASR
ncbi:MAG: type I pullulanase [Candidatus Enteromonas sp.]